MFPHSQEFCHLPPPPPPTPPSKSYHTQAPVLNLATLVTQVLNKLSPNNMQVELISQNHNGSVCLSHTKTAIFRSSLVIEKIVGGNITFYGKI